jgi:predicted dehydrogenase
MNVGIIGCGVMGRLHAQMAMNCGLNVMACADTKLEAANALGERFAAEPFVDGNALIARDDVDIVVIATPTPWHTPYITAAAEAGKHIFCEKPLARTLDTANDALKAVRKAGARLFVGQVVRYFHEYEAIRLQVQSGVIGKPGFVKTYRGGGIPSGQDGWFADFTRSGGTILDIAIHDLDWMCSLFGDPERVFAHNVLKTDPFPMDYGVTTVRFKNGTMGTAVTSWAQPKVFRTKVEVCGDGGLLEFDSGEAPLQVALHEVETAQDYLPMSPVRVSPYELEWRDFLQWLENGTEPRVTADDALRSLRLCLAALESAETGKAVRL